MSHLISITSPDQLAEHDASLLPVFDPQTLLRQQPQAHWLASNSAGQITARLSLWWQQVPPHPTHRLGLIGHFAAANVESSTALLTHALKELAAHGCSLAVGPMDGSTWRRYRLLSERGTEPPFFLEPDNPDGWTEWFAAAGFSPFATYFSAVSEDLSIEDPRIPRTMERLERSGIRLRPLQPGQFSEELRRIYAVSRISFQDNFLYTPICEAEFLAQYEAVRPYVRPELVLLAECEAQPVGFVFSVPDLLQAKRGQSIDTVVLKTVAVLPGRTYAGLGNVLVARCHQVARHLGYRRVLHALMHETNNSLNLSGHYAKPFRRYTLFAREA